MYNQYLIPANTKRGQLILGLFRPFDLILFGVGILITVLLLAFIPISSTLVTFLILSPAVITGFLVMPVPYYHNMLNILVELYEFITNRQTYRWKGWCYKSAITKTKGKK
ncbi:MAG: hypothetical protein IJ193_05670 [Bacilli bacterium]|nr:hypothetical protein [Bacilli bacterium]